MRLLALLSFLFATSAQAEVAKIVCIGVDGYTFESTLENLNVQKMINGECEEKIFTEELCYKGQQAEVIEILKGLSDGGIVGDGASFRSFRVSKSRISYTVWDDQDSTEIVRVAIKQCKGFSSKRN